MDLVDLTKEIDKLNTETIPLIQLTLDKLMVDLHELVDRLNNTMIVTSITIPPRKNP
jgi:hypothetical protein